VVGVMARATYALGAGLAICLSCTAIPAQAAAPAAATAAHGWRLTEVYGRGAANIDAAGLTVASRDSAWSIWDQCTWPCESGVTNVVRHWNGHVWTAIPASELHGMSDQFMAASSASDAWMFGYFPGQRYYGALHWNGKTWSKRSVPDWLIYANGSGAADVYTADFGPNDLWLFSLGGYVGQKTAYAAHYENGHWTKSYLPDIPDAAAAISSRSIWLLGQSKPEVSPTGPTYLLHWNGRRWSRSAFPRQRSAGLPEGLLATGPNDMWTTWVPAKASVAPYLLHWTGRDWARVAFPKGGTGAPATGDGAGGLWLNGLATSKARVQLFLHWSAGHWRLWPVPQKGWQPGNVDYLALIPGTTSVWATGNVYGPGGGTTLNRGTVWRFN
jgi:hypothetical protein